MKNQNSLMNEKCLPFFYYQKNIYVNGLSICAKLKTKKTVRISSKTNIKCFFVEYLNLYLKYILKLFFDYFNYLLFEIKYFVILLIIFVYTLFLVIGNIQEKIHSPFSHTIVSIGYPATGHLICSAFPATADIGAIGRTYGIP